MMGHVIMSGIVPLLVYNFELVSYYGALTALTVANKLMDVATNSKYVIFAGGAPSPYTKGKIAVAYDENFVQSLPTQISGYFSDREEGTVGDKAVFTGGWNRATNNASTNSVDAYDTSLTKTTSSISAARYMHATASDGVRLLAAGGTVWRSSSFLATVDCFDVSLTRTAATSMSIGRAYLRGISGNGRYYFSGGQPYTSSGVPNSSTTIDIYDSSLTHSVMNMTTGRRLHNMAHINNKIMIIGGMNYTDGVEMYAIDSVEIIDDALTISLSSIINSRYNAECVNNDNTLMVIGGADSDKNNPYDINVYDKSLTLKSTMAMSENKIYFAAAYFKGYCIMAGGMVNNSMITTAEAYEMK